MWAGTGVPIAIKWTLSNHEEPPLTTIDLLRELLTARHDQIRG